MQDVSLTIASGINRRRCDRGMAAGRIGQVIEANSTNLADEECIYHMPKTEDTRDGYVFMRRSEFAFKALIFAMTEQTLIPHAMP